MKATKPVLLDFVPSSVLTKCEASGHDDSRAGAAAQGETFTAEEKEQLCAMFSLNSEQLGQMLEGCTLVFEQFAYNVSKPAATATALDTAGFTEEHVRARPAPRPRGPLPGAGLIGRRDLRARAGGGDLFGVGDGGGGGAEARAERAVRAQDAGLGELDAQPAVVGGHPGPDEQAHR